MYNQGVVCLYSVLCYLSIFHWLMIVEEHVIPPPHPIKRRQRSYTIQLLLPLYLSL